MNLDYTNHRPLIYHLCCCSPNCTLLPYCLILSDTGSLWKTFGPWLTQTGSLIFPNLMLNVLWNIAMSQPSSNLFTSGNSLALDKAGRLPGSQQLSFVIVRLCYMNCFYQLWSSLDSWVLYKYGGNGYRICILLLFMRFFGLGALSAGGLLHYCFSECLVP